MAETIGVTAAVASSALGGTAVAITRHLADRLDPATLGAARFAIGFAVLAPIAAVAGGRWPSRRDLPAVAAVGLLFFAVFPWLFNAALALTTAARGALALSTLPLLTMAAAALLRVEHLTRRKTVGVLLAVGGVAAALGAGLADAPAGAWRGDLVMVGAASCMALYNVLSRPLIARSGPVPFTACGMGAGAIALALVSWSDGGPATLEGLSVSDWTAVAYLGIVCAALVFWLWALALAHATPTRVAVSVAVNPLAAGLLGAVVLDEAMGASLVVGLAAVTTGIAVATTEGGAAWRMVERRRWRPSSRRAPPPPRSPPIRG
ncbi:MAG: DMT family transporter [Alphaproteobacteria bacterium]